jgi:hypothetical protein
LEPVGKRREASRLYGVVKKSAWTRFRSVLLKTRPTAFTGILNLFEKVGISKPKSSSCQANQHNPKAKGPEVLEQFFHLLNKFLQADFILFDVYICLSNKIRVKTVVTDCVAVPSTRSKLTPLPSV